VDLPTLGIPTIPIERLTRSRAYGALCRLPNVLCKV
jgi:hypothetical protein